MIRNCEVKDLEQVLALNEKAVPHVNSLKKRDLLEFMKLADYFWVVEKEQHVVAFLIVIGPGRDYDSTNYQYFDEKYDDFHYVDRIVVRSGAKREGLGKALYTKLFEESAAQRITCEVNIEPPNPVSMSFHAISGFGEVAKQHSENGKKWVSLMAKELS